MQDRHFVEVDVFSLFCLQTKREGEKEPLQPFSYQVGLPWKHQSPEKDKYNTEQVRHDPLTSHPATSTSDKWNSFLSCVSRTLHGSLVTHRNMASLWKWQTFLVPLQVEIWPHLFMLIYFKSLQHFTRDSLAMERLIWGSAKASRFDHLNFFSWCPEPRFFFFFHFWKWLLRMIKYQHY